MSFADVVEHLRWEAEQIYGRNVAELIRENEPERAEICRQKKNEWLAAAALLENADQERMDLEHATES